MCLVAQAVQTSPPSKPTRDVLPDRAVERSGLSAAPRGFDAADLHEVVVAGAGCPEDEEAACGAGA